MKKAFLAAILAFSLMHCADLMAADKDEDSFQPSLSTQKFSFAQRIDFLFLPHDQSLFIAEGIFFLDEGDSFSIENYSQKVKESIAQFSLDRSASDVFFLEFPPEITPTSKIRKNYSRAAFQIGTLNMIAWTFNRFVMKESWANISLESILTNLQSGFAWDIDTFRTNQLGHPWHGAIHYSIGRANGLGFLESTLFSTLGSLTWEIFLESITPSTNDLFMNTLGGITLGEVLYKISDLIIDESSIGLERALRETFAFLINPAFGFRAFSGEAFRTGSPPESHYYSFDLPFGAFSLPDDKTIFLLAGDLEYKDFLKDDVSSISPYEWFSLNFRLGFHDSGLMDKEIFTTGIITGRKVKNGAAGLFGVFDYINSYALDKMSAVGVGPGLVILTVSDSDLFFNSSGVLSFILGGSSPTFNSPKFHFGLKTDDPYYFGPGLLGRIKMELGKKGVGSIDTGFSQYWVHSIFDEANEFLSILCLNLKCDVTDRSQVSFGYDYYLRRGTLHDQSFTGGKPALRALYILKF